MNLFFAECYIFLHYVLPESYVFISFAIKHLCATQLASVFTVSVMVIKVEHTPKQEHGSSLMPS